MTRARDIADQQDNLGGAVAPYVAGKNAVINGAFDYWQRGTSFSNPVNEAFTADRMSVLHDGTGATRTISQQTLAPATITGYDSRYFYRYVVSAAGTSNTYQRFGTKIENVQNLTGTITVSFWAKADTNRTVSFQLDQYYGSGGSSATVGLQLSAMASVTTSWQRFSATGTLASISGKTIGDGSYVYAYFAFPHNTTLTIDVAGFQIEQGSVATPFARSTGTLQGELAACHRYYYQIGPGAAYASFGIGGFHPASTSFMFIVNTPVVMRTVPTFTTVGAFQTNGTGVSLTGLGFNGTYSNSASYNGQASCTGATTGYGSTIRNTDDTTAKMMFSSEL